MPSIKDHIVIALLVAINFIFCYKYATRYTDYALVLSLSLLIAQIYGFYYHNRLARLTWLPKAAVAVLLGFITLLVIVSHTSISLDSLQVDRWSVISSFIHELSQGNYPYYARSHLGNPPGPMPIYFLIALPFHLLGELSLLSALGYTILAIALVRNYKESTYTMPISIFLLTSVFMFWEITTRSNLFTFSLLVVFVLDAFDRSKDHSQLSFYGIAICAGLMLSTRSVYILPYVVFYLSALSLREISYKKIILFTLVSMSAFALSFLPFLLYFYDDFWTINPFIIQSSFLIPSAYTLLFIAIAIVLGLLVRSSSDKHFYSGISLFIAISIYALFHIHHSGLTRSYMESKVDISYFIFSVPFLLLYLLHDDENPTHAEARK